MNNLRDAHKINSSYNIHCKDGTQVLVNLMVSEGTEIYNDRINLIIKMLLDELNGTLDLPVLCDIISFISNISFEDSIKETTEKEFESICTSYGCDMQQIMTSGYTKHDKISVYRVEFTDCDIYFLKENKSITSNVNFRLIQIKKSESQKDTIECNVDNLLDRLEF